MTNNNNQADRFREGEFREVEFREGEAPAEPVDHRTPPAEPARQEPRPPASPLRPPKTPPRHPETFANPHQRHHPIHGVIAPFNTSVIVFLTVCTKDRAPWLATADHHQLLREVWANATAWLVGRYVVLPDHVHLFAAPGNPELPLDNWVTYWKSQFTKRNGKPNCRWQTDHWDTRLRHGDSYDAKWMYVVNNPVRHQLVEKPDDWPYQGELNELRWE